MTTPLLSIIIPTHNRPHLLPRAVESALAQTLESIEVIVVDDASTEPVQLPDHPRLRVIRLETSHGGAGARNVGTAAAQGRWVTYLDDDDRLLPHMAALSLAALEQATVPPPIAVISGIEVVNPQGKMVKVRLPPSLSPKGANFSLEELEAGRSYNTKQTMVVERVVIQQMGGWDAAFRSRVHTELFLRLNQVCSIVGLATATYQLYEHAEVRVSSNLSLRRDSFRQLVTKHDALFRAHPHRFAELVYEHGLILFRAGQYKDALASLCWAIQINPGRALYRFCASCWQTLDDYVLTALRA
ncbi:MAG: glycosyltransferase [Leptolyngbyaceae cyanobacterium SL_7_1]|nr:glycosyltransferase [Leptolyngbyaceae cyanobacterium SL_7_1]